MRCPSFERLIETSTGQRRVHYRWPDSPPPPQGYPVVFLFQGSLFPAEDFFAASRSAPFGGYNGALLTQRLLGHGYAVVAPETHLGGRTWWDTNVPLWSATWTSSPDADLMRALFADIARGALGPLDATRFFAAGISSGGYMTSRMGLAFPGRFRALAIASASYATCSGPFCRIPARLPPNHPPTLFLHGARDALVPLSTMQAYREQLAREGHDVDAIIDPAAGHAWLGVAPEAIPSWFDRH